MAKFSVFLALCFFFCVASAQLDPTAKIVEFDSSLLVAGANITEWVNTGSLGGTLVSVGGVGVPVQAECGGLNRGQGVFFNGEVFEGDLASPITFSASVAVVVVIVASSTGPTSGILTTGPAGGPGSDPALLGPGALYTGVYTQDAEDVSVGSVNTFAAAAVGDAVAVAFVYETPIGNTGNDFWITADNSGTTVSGLGANVRNQFGWAAIGDRLGLDTGFVGCIHYLAIYQVLTTPVNEDALASTLLDLAIEFSVATNQTTASPAPRTTGSTTGSTTGTTGSTTGSRTTGRRATTHVSSATIPAVPSLLFAAIVSFFLFFLW